MLRGVVFDMDGVLIDSHPAHLKAWRMLLAQVGRIPSDEDLQFVLDGRKREDIVRHFLGRLTEDQLLGVSRRKEELFMDLAAQVRLIPGVLDFVRSLRRAKIAMAVATSASRSRAERMLQQFGLDKMFHAVVTGDDVTHGKPDPAIFRLAGESLAQSPDDLIAIDDAVSGIQSARAAGMRCVGIGPVGREAALSAAGAQLVRANFVGLKVSELRSMCTEIVVGSSASAKTRIQTRHQLE